MAENMYSPPHKTSNKEYRDKYDQIRWDKPKKQDNSNKNNTK